MCILILIIVARCKTQEIINRIALYQLRSAVQNLKNINCKEPLEYCRRCPVLCEIQEGWVRQCPRGSPDKTQAKSIVSDLHQRLGSGRRRHSYMIRMYVDKNIHIVFVHVAGRGVRLLVGLVRSL